ncbi:uncharacterized protein EI97DRAFT_460497 [Westerdykella ornata]|uniref:CCHC-type domain-containing protein n=1 Tax=Westerdykella ornata TaxID=318751 RepID=A0A6A6JCZ5_WESOR|nr:uncharacterized protein EI97DRAFT_460497 [Westerdykella ornata]KAF2274104.1 hypothetical protein EI97DRAFT_460497 [Westerdykella ornata]
MGLELMHLDSVIKGPSLSKDNDKKGKKILSCYACGKPGHIMRNCRSKNKVVQYVNTLITLNREDATIGQDGDPEWVVIPNQVWKPESEEMPWTQEDEDADTPLLGDVEEDTTGYKTSEERRPLIPYPTPTEFLPRGEITSEADVNYLIHEFARQIQPPPQDTKE